jgi:hypothetical protein
MTKKTVFKFGNKFTDFFNIKNMDNTKKIAVFVIFVLISFVVYYIVKIFLKYLKDPLSAVTDFLTYAISELGNLLTSCTKCDGVYDSRGKLQTPQQTCPTNGKPFINNKCLLGIGLLIAGVIGSLAALAKIKDRITKKNNVSEDKLSKKQKIKNILEKLNKPMKDYIKDARDTREQIKKNITDKEKQQLREQIKQQIEAGPPPLPPKPGAPQPPPLPPKPQATPEQINIALNETIDARATKEGLRSALPPSIDMKTATEVLTVMDTEIDNFTEKKSKNISIQKEATAVTEKRWGTVKTDLGVRSNQLGLNNVNRGLNTAGDAVGGVDVDGSRRTGGGGVDDDGRAPIDDGRNPINDGIRKGSK